MRIDGITLREGSQISNLTVASGAAFPSNANTGEVFYRTSADRTIEGLYIYLQSSWTRVSTETNLISPGSATLPSTGADGELYFLSSNNTAEGLYYYDITTTSWKSVAPASALTFTGDVTGSGSGSIALTLGTVNSSPGVVGSASAVPVLTVIGKGLVTSSTSTPIAIGTGQVTSGTFADARIAQSNVTQWASAIAAGSAAILTTARTIGISGAATGTATSFNGSANITIPVTGIDLTHAGLSGVLGVDHGSTGQSSYTIGDILYASAAGVLSKLAAGTANQVLRSNGAGTAPSYATLDMSFLPDSVFKKSVRVATTANITLSGAQTIDGIAVVAGDRVLVKNQTAAAANGIYVVAAGAWTRALDADISAEIAGAVVSADVGTVNGGDLFTATFKTSDVLGTTAMVWSEVTTNDQAQTLLNKTLVTPVLSAAAGTAPFTVTSTTPVANLSIGGNAATATNALTIEGYPASSLIKFGDVIMNTNGFGGKKLYLNVIDNAMAAASKKWYVTATLHLKSYASETWPKANPAYAASYATTGSGTTYTVATSPSDIVVYVGDNLCTESVTPTTQLMYTYSAGNLVFGATPTATIYVYPGPTITAQLDSPVSTTLDAAGAFDGNYEGGLTVPIGSYLKLRVTFNAAGTGSFPGYPYGTYYLSYYYSATPLGTTIRTYNRNFRVHGIGWKLDSFSDFIGTPAGTAYVQSFTDSGNYGRTILEFIVPADTTHSTILSDIDWSLQRPDLSTHGSAVTKYGSNKLYFPLTFGDQLTNKVVIDPSGLVTAINFTATGTITAPTFVGSLTGNASTASLAALATSVNAVDSRNVVSTPIIAPKGISFDFKLIANAGISDGGIYAGLVTYRPWGSTTDWSGGAAYQTVFTDNGNMHIRKGSSATWEAWKKVWTDANLTNLNQLTNGPGFITSAGSITGNAASATVLATARTIAISGAATGTATSFSGAANITIPITALDMTHAGISGILGVDHGGTGFASYAIGDILYASAPGVLSKLSPGTAGQVLTTNGPGAAPSYTTVTTNVTNISGNAGTATALETPRAIGISGPITGTPTFFDGTGGITIPVTALDVGHAALTGVLAIDHGGTGTTTSTGTGSLVLSTSPTFDGTVNGTFSGNLTGNVTGNVSGTSGSTTGNAATATALATSRTISIGGIGSSSGASFNGTSDITISLTSINVGGAGIVGTVSPYNGGTGISSYAVGDILFASTTTALSKLAAGTANQVLRSNGPGVAPSYTTLDMSFLPDSVFKKSVRVATTANIALSAPQTIDGIAVVVGDRVLVKNQTASAQNGIYVVAAGAWTRAADADISAEVAGAVVSADVGTVNGGDLFTATFKTTDTLGTTAMVWSEVTTNDQVQTLTGKTLVSPNLTGTPTAVTAASSDATTQIATTAYVKSLFSTPGTAGVLDWNDATNVKPGVGPALLMGSATNGPPIPGGYFFPLNLEYNGLNGNGQITQMAIAYGNVANELFMRGRYSGAWTGWTRFLNSYNFNSYAPSLTGSGASGSWNINAATATAATSAVTTTTTTVTGFLAAHSSSSANTAATLGGFSVRYLAGGATEKPTGSTDGALLSQSYSNGSYSTQLYSDWRTNGWWVRVQNNTAWGSWDRLVREGQSNTFTASNMFTGPTTYTADVDFMTSAVSMGGVVTMSGTQNFSGTANFTGTVNLDLNALSGVLPAAKGGTGISTYTTGAILQATGPTTLVQRTPAELMAQLGGMRFFNQNTVPTGANFGDKWLYNLTGVEYTYVKDESETGGNWINLTGGSSGSVDSSYGLPVIYSVTQPLEEGEYLWIQVDENGDPESLWLNMNIR